MLDKELPIFVLLPFARIVLRDRPVISHHTRPDLAPRALVRAEPIDISRATRTFVREMAADQTSSFAFIEIHAGGVA